MAYQWIRSGSGWALTHPMGEIVARVWPAEKAQGYMHEGTGRGFWVLMKFPKATTLTWTAYTSAPRARAYVGRRLAKLPNPPAIARPGVLPGGAP